MDTPFDKFETQKRKIHSSLGKFETLILPSLHLKQVNPILRLEILEGNFSEVLIKDCSKKVGKLDNDQIILTTTELQEELNTRVK